MPRSEAKQKTHRQNILAWRRELCVLVVELSKKRVPEESAAAAAVDENLEDLVAKTLDPFFASLARAIDEEEEKERGRGEEEHNETFEDNEADPDDDTDGITPLIVACDTGNLECVRYFCRLLETNSRDGAKEIASRRRVQTHRIIIGHPLRSASRPAHNTAFHHATTGLAARAEHRQKPNSRNNADSFLELLERILLAQREPKDGAEPPGLTFTEHFDSVSHRDNAILALGAAVNVNGDTPLMTVVANNVFLGDTVSVAVATADNEPSNNTAIDAVASGCGGISSAKELLARWYTLALERSSQSHDSNSNSTAEQATKTAIRTILRATNQSRGSILSYAASAGIVDVVQWLIDVDNDGHAGSLPIITAEDAHLCQNNLDDMHRAWKKLVTSCAQQISEDKRRLYHEQRAAVEECQRLLNSHLVERSERMAHELLGETSQPAKPARKRKKKKKKKQPSVPPESSNGELVDGNNETVSVSSRTEENGQESSSWRNIAGDESAAETTVDDNALCVTKLANGRLAVRVAGLNEDEAGAAGGRENRADGAFPPLSPAPVYRRRRTLSLDETNQLLRDRYRQGSASNPTAPDASNENRSETAPTTSVSGSNNGSSASDADSVLSALCLDVNCLLYSDHGMALHLSPAQLDAVERILREQLESVRKARALQERRFRAGATSAASAAGIEPRPGVSNET